MNAKRRAWAQTQAVDKQPLVLKAGAGMVQVSPTEVRSAPLSQIDVIKEGAIWTVYQNTVLLLSFNNEQTAEQFSQQRATELRLLGHRVFRTVQA